ncbi:zf-HC2 domain-containing protein [Micromonospora sp. WMMD1120]|uniref:zf-HC2 domain-containing protein n=1 Tax=Micromonospora sp. WMMD1120 TaxID=3016106 RepID=UPI002416BC65|nr:zf-HC2 domain-containing protein [Micromonospora sp. WMMD1120]MDG4805580.1 zf-HC2 domain-containing protein [Micromonospora sp. WMMD1120]
MTTHPTWNEIDGYAHGDPALDEVTVWSVEMHLEGCADCRARLAGSTTAASRALVTTVAVAVDREIAAGPAPTRRPRFGTPVRRRWFVGALLPWVGMTAAVLGAAALLTHLLPELPSLVLLLAPLAPLPGVAAAWSRRVDPAWELIAGTPSAGLTMLLRRTAVVLVLVIPVLAAFTTVGGSRVNPALLLLPSLAFTAATLLLGSVVGVHRAAIGLMAVWAAVVIAPSLVTADLPVVLEPAATGGWALGTAALAVLTLLRAGSFRRLVTY